MLARVAMGLAAQPERRPPELAPRQAARGVGCPAAVVAAHSGAAPVEDLGLPVLRPRPV